MTSENEKTVHQQCSTEVDKALDYLESDRAWPDYEPPGGDTRDSADVLIGEVRRLREESRLFADAGHAAELWIVEFREEVADLQRDKAFLIGLADAKSAKLARVEALPGKWREHAEKRHGRHGEYGDGRVTQADCCADELEAALKD